MKKARPQYEPYKYGSKEAEEQLIAIADVLRKHITTRKKFRADHAAHRFMGTFDTLMEDFWTREQAGAALDDLRHALKNIQSAYMSVPRLVRQEVELNASQQDYFAGIQMSAALV